MSIYTRSQRAQFQETYLAQCLGVGNGFTFLGGWKKNQGRNQNFVTSESDTKFKFQHPEIKFYWSTALLAALHVAHGMCTTTAELRSCDRQQRLCGPMGPFFTIWPFAERMC